MSETNLKLVIALARTHDVLFDKIEDNVQGFGLTISEFGVLEMLYHKGEQPVQRVAEKILVTSGTITYVIDKLVGKNLVERVRCQDDKRVIYVHLTPAGKKMIGDIFPAHEAFLDEILRPIPPGAIQCLTDHLASLQKVLKESNKDLKTVGGKTFA